MEDHNSKPIWIVGPSGSGKTRFAQNLMKGMRQEFVSMSDQSASDLFVSKMRKKGLIYCPMPHTHIETYYSLVAYQKDAPVIVTAQFTPPHQVREHFELINLAIRPSEDELLPLEVKKALDRLFMTTIGTDLLMTADQYKRALSARANKLIQVLGALRVLGDTYTEEEFIQLLKES